MRALQIAATALVTAGALAGPAPAQEPGLTIDPESPSAKEYALPFENERRQADPGAGPGVGIAPGARSSPAFGVGVTAKGGDDAQEEGAAATGGSGGAGAGGTGSGSDGEETSASESPDGEDVAETIRQATAQPGAPDDGLGGTLLAGGIAAVVLAVAGGAGLLLRRRAT